MIYLDYAIIQFLMVIWFLNTIKSYPTKGDSFSYYVLVGNIGTSIIISAVALYTLVKGESFIQNLIEVFLGYSASKYIVLLRYMLGIAAGLSAVLLMIYGIKRKDSMDKLARSGIIGIGVLLGIVGYYLFHLIFTA